jgi:hypothetical protein
MSQTKPFFIPQKEFDLINQMNEELIDEIIGQSVDIYKVNGSLNFYPEIGDIVDWNDYYWEINGTTEPQLFAGHPNFKHNIVATAHRSRLSSLQIEERPR